MLISGTALMCLVNVIDLPLDKNSAKVDVSYYIDANERRFHERDRASQRRSVA
jgi:hypothetical protein